MGLGKSGLILSIITGIGLSAVWYLDKIKNVEIPQIEIIAITLGGLLILGLAIAHYGGKSHLRKHGYLK
jgi:hypothetical protein